jgi:hypothetical protein
MEQCKALVTITGTAGIEAMVRRMPVFAFGNAAYLNGPGVYRIKEASDLAQALKKDVDLPFDNAQKFIMALDGCANHLDDSLYATKNPLSVAQGHHVTCILKALNYNLE